MSWKSFITAGLLCVLASPVFAAPNVSLATGGGAAATGHLDAAGNWVWTVKITADQTLMPSGDTSGTPVAAELGFLSSSTRSGDIPSQGNVIQAARTGGTVFDTRNPGNVVFSAWQTGALLDAASNNKPTGIQANCPGGSCALAADSYTTNSVTGAANQVFAALGSSIITSAAAQDVMTITVNRPVVTAGDVNTSTTIKITGAYNSDGTASGTPGTAAAFGRLSQINGGTNGGPYTTGSFNSFGGASYSFTMNARGGDANLDGSISVADYSALIGKFNQAGTWQDGDFNGDGTVSVADYSMLLGTFGQSYTVGVVSPGAGSGGGLSGGNVPEPASAVLLGLALLGGLGLRRRS